MQKKLQAAWQASRYLPRLIRFTWEASPLYLLLALLTTLLNAFVVPVQVWTTKIIIDRVSATVHGDLSLDWYYLMAPLLLVALVWVIGVGGRGLSSEIQMMLAFKVRHHAEYCVLEKATQLDVAFFETPAFFDRMDNARRHIFQAHNLPILVLDMLSSFLSLGIMLGLLAQLHLGAVAVLIVTAAPLLIVRAYFSDRMWRFMKDQTPARRMVTYLADLLGARDPVKEVRLFALHRPFLERFESFWQQHFAAEKRIRLVL
ncbi:MAG: hypothetical protein GKR89_36400 [Candidatus Latescibacteria bacterium]|nr:hypothetical protein [Candidatus Latescibacterota bacterium]